MKLLSQLAAQYLTGGHRQLTEPATYQEEQQGRINAECQRIKKAWTDLLFSQTKDHVIKRYTGFQQQVIQEIADSLYRRIEKSKITVSPDNHVDGILVRFLLERLVQLKDFQIQYFNAYINEEGKIPDVETPAVRKRMAESAEKLSARLQNIEMDVQLKACILDYLSMVITPGGDAPISYRAAEYLLSFTDSLSVTVDFHDNRDLTHGVTEVLFYMNFNHNGFCQWYQDGIAAKKALLRPHDQLLMLMKQQLLLKSMQVMLKTGYDPKTLPVNELLENWLNELIGQESLLTDNDGDQPGKIELKLTVAQLALLIRLLYEEDVFAMKNIAALLRFFSGHFMSKKQEHISYGSMNKLYYSGDQFTGYAVRGLLLKMVAKINKMFFPV